MIKYLYTLLFSISFLGCNAEHGTPVWVEAKYGGPPPQILKLTPEGGTALIYIATPEEIKKAVEEQDWDWQDSKNNAFVKLTLGGDRQHRRLRCELRRSGSDESHPLQITAFDGKQHLVANIDSPDQALSVLTCFLEDDPQWKEALDWKPVPKEED